MRDIQAEKMIAKKLIMHFGLDPARFDVSVINRECTFSGQFMVKDTQKPAEFMRMTEIRKFFSPSAIQGVDNYYFELRDQSV